jgi:DNA primase
MIGRDDLADLKSRLRLSDYVGRRVKLSPGNGDRFGLCPFHDEKSGSFTVNDAKGFYHCFGCAAHGDILDWWQKADGLSFVDALEKLRQEAGALPPRAPDRREPGDEDRDAAAKWQAARDIWKASQPIGGTLAETYLRDVRRIGIELSGSLLFHPGLLAGEGVTFPAMVAAVTDANGSIVAIQRTFLAPDGSGKAAIERPKRALGPVKLGAVKLGPAAATMGIAEGIETGLSAQELFHVPVWCALGSDLARIELPPLARNVAIFADKGEAGERAAALAVETFGKQGRRIAVKFAPGSAKDWNDHLKALRRGR